MDAVQDEVFRGFVAARGHALIRTAYLLTGDQHLAEDLVQTALEKAVQHWAAIRDVGAAEQYVRRTMYRENISLWRRRRLTELPTQWCRSRATSARPRTPPTGRPTGWSCGTPSCGSARSSGPCSCCATSRT